MNSLHASVKKLAGGNPALVLSLNALRGLLLNNFVEAIKYFEDKKDKSVPIEGFPEIEARFTGPKVDLRSFKLSSSKVGDKVVVGVTPGFTATIALHVKDNTKLQFSTIDITVTKLKFSVTASAPNILLGAPDFDVKGKIKLSKATRKKALGLGTIKEDDVVRIEGAMAYVMPRRVVASVLSTISSIDLAERFTAFELRGDWTLYEIDGNLVIIPSGGIVIREDVGCPIKDSAPNLNFSTKTMDSYSEVDTIHSWEITNDGVPELEVKPAIYDDVGFAALYAPKPIWDARFAKVMPGVVYRENNNGFIGYELTFNVGLKYLRLEIDPRRFGIVIDLELMASGTAFLTVDVPCVGRSDLAYARFSCEQSNLSILLSFVLQSDGKLVLESQIEQLDIGQVDATVSFFSRWLALAGGKAAVVGFIMDYLLKRVIEHNLPVKIRDAIKRELNSKNFELLDFGELVQFTEYGMLDGVTFSGEPHSVLVGLGSFG